METTTATKWVRFSALAVGAACLMKTTASNGLVRFVKVSDTSAKRIITREDGKRVWRTFNLVEWRRGDEWVILA